MVKYDPSISALVNQAEDDWGDQEINRKNLVGFTSRKWGTSIIDRSLYGIDLRPSTSSVISIQGREKARKSTFAANIVKNICMSKDKLPDGFRIAVDSLESGMPPGRWRDMLISMTATEILLDDHWGDQIPRNGKYETGGRYKQAVKEYIDIPHMGITPEFLRYRTRTRQQKWAIEQAKRIVAEFPLDIYGPGSTQGDTTNLELSQQRWERVHEKRGTSMLVVDHVQQYRSGGPSDYKNLETSVGAISRWAVRHGGTALILSQVSLTSVRNSREYGGNLIAKGGAVLAAESNVLFDVSYKENSDVMTLHVSRSRRAAPPTCWQGLDKRSGLFVLAPFGPIKDF